MDVPKNEYCKVNMTEADQKAFVYAVKNQYWYQMYMDDLPIWGIFYIFNILRCFIPEVKKQKKTLYFISLQELSVYPKNTTELYHITFGLTKK